MRNRRKRGETVLRRSGVRMKKTLPFLILLITDTILNFFTLFGLIITRNYAYMTVALN